GPRRRARGRSRSAAMVTLGQGLAKVHDARTDRGSGDESPVVRRRDSPARRGLLQRPALTSTDRGGASCDHQRAKPVGTRYRPACLTSLRGRTTAERSRATRVAIACRRGLLPTLRGPAARISTMTTASTTERIPDFSRFAIGFDHRDRARLHALIDEVLDSERWSEASLTERFETAWERWNEAPAVAASSWAGGTLAALDLAGVAGETVLCPSNTFMATPLAALRSGARVEFVDCNREDLCMSFSDFEAKAERHRARGAFLVHIGAHIACDVERVAAYCRDHGIFLIEDCAHAHGASWNGRKPGTWGDAGVYSLYATKTISTGEGGVLVSRRSEVLDHARAFRNYGKPDYALSGLNYRMSEFTAALG